MLQISVVERILISLMQNCPPTDRAKENRKRMKTDDDEQKKWNCRYSSVISNFEIVFFLL